MMAPSPPFFRVTRPPRGVRRRRDDELELEPLDSQTMRQSSYNYFQQQQQQQQQQYLDLPTFQSSLRHSAASRKRQRTLAEQMESLTLARDGSSRASSRFVELDERGRERAASDADDDSGEDDEASDGDHGEMLVYGGVPNSMRRFFEPARRDRRPLDRIYRHYISLATKNHRDATDAGGKELVVFRRPPPSLSSAGAVPDSAPPAEMTLPRYLSITPQDFQRLSTEEKRQWYQMHMRYLGQRLDQERDDAMSAGEKLERGGGGDADKREAKPTPLTSLPSFTSRRSRSSSASSSGSFHAIGVPATDEGFGSGDDVEMMEDDDMPASAPKIPHLAGAVTHTEWFDDVEL